MTGEEVGAVVVGGGERWRWGCEKRGGEVGEGSHFRSVRERERSLALSELGEFGDDAAETKWLDSKKKMWRIIIRNVIYH